MSDTLTLQELSRGVIGDRGRSAENPSSEGIAVGALLRIADSLEKMVDMAKEDPTAGNISKLMNIVEAERNGSQ